MKIKKSFEEIIAFLEANKSKKVNDLMDTIYQMVESKKQSEASIKDADGNVLAVYCYYHKQWEIVKEVEYGPKKSTSTGLDTMCRVGVRLWTKTNNGIKKAKGQLLNDVAEGKVKPSDILKAQEDIEAQRNMIDETDMPKGYASQDEVRKVLGLNK